MRRIAGIILLAIGLVPFSIFLLGVVVWAQHMYTIGIDQNLRIIVLSIGAVDPVCIGLGVYLMLDRRRISN